MRNLLLLFISISFLTKINAQCSPNFIYTTLGVPGVYPSPLLLAIDDGEVSYPYSEVLTIVTVEDTNMDVSSLLPTSVVLAMNLAGISTTMNVNVNHSTYDISGLPNGLSYQCSDPNCQYSPSIDGCILIDDTPTEGGNFTVNVNQTLNIQIPPITTLFSGMAVDVPAFSAQEYDLFIDGLTSINNKVNHKSKLYPNPTKDFSFLEVKEKSEVSIFNVLGKKVFTGIVDEKLLLDKNKLGTGIFYI